MSSENCKTCEGRDWGLCYHLEYGPCLWLENDKPEKTNNMSKTIDLKPIYMQEPKRFFADAGKYDILNFIPVFRIYFDVHSLYFEVEFLRYYACIGILVKYPKS